MDLSILRRGVDCHEFLKYNELRLDSPSPDAYVEATTNALAALKEALKQRGEREQAFGAVKRVLDEAYPEMLPSAEAEKEAVQSLVGRVINYIFDCGYNNANLEFDQKISLKTDAVVGESAVDMISTKVDMLIETDSIVRAVKFELGEQPYTDREGSKNHVRLSEELAVMYLSFKNQGKEVVPELWFLKGKDDRAGQPLPAFEYREKKNIAKYKFTEEEARATLSNFFMREEEPKCEACKYRDVCKQTSYSDVRLITKKIKAVKNPTFTPEQEQVIEHFNGPAAVIAVPGSGKTFTVSYRFKRLVEQGVKLESILCISFTASAAKDMEEKIRQITGIGEELSITTFNAFGYGILIDNPLLVGKRVKLADETDRKQILERALNECPRVLGVSYSQMKGERGLINELMRKFRVIQDSGIEAFHNKFDAKYDTEGMLRVYKREQELLKEGGYITFDDQVSLTNDLFRRFPKLVDVLAEKYTHIMVDEFQDTNKEQKEMIYAIARRHNNLVVVGDDDQSIYSFRGGSNRFLLDFAKDFKGARVFRLTKNFRSVSHILEVANAVMDGVEDRYEKVLRANTMAQNRVYFSKGGMKTVVDYCSEFIRKFNYKPSDVCVLARTNSELLKIQDCLAAAGIDSTCPKDRLIDDPVFNIMQACFKLSENLDDDHALARLFRWFKAPVPKKEIADVSLSHFLFYTGKVEMYEDYEYSEKETFEALPEVRGVMHRVYAIVTLLRKSKLLEAIDKISDILLMPGNYMVVDEIKDMIELKGFTTPKEVANHMEQMKLYGDTARVIYDVDKKKVRLVTEHDSKGHEYPAVIIYGMEDFEVEKEEERRLLYVSITRAKQVLVMIEGDGPRRFEGYDWIKDLVVKPRRSA